MRKMDLKKIKNQLLCHLLKIKILSCIIVSHRRLAKSPVSTGITLDMLQGYADLKTLFKLFKHNTLKSRERACLWQNSSIFLLPFCQFHSKISFQYDHSRRHTNIIHWHDSPELNHLARASLKWQKSADCSHPSRPSQFFPHCHLFHLLPSLSNTSSYEIRKMNIHITFLSREYCRLLAAVHNGISTSQSDFNFCPFLSAAISTTVFTFPEYWTLLVLVRFAYIEMNYMNTRWADMRSERIKTTFNHSRIMINFLNQ